MADTASQAEVKRKFPVVSGLGANDKHEGRQMNLVPEQGSLVPRRKKVGL
jgi:hypothetical protein